MASPQDLPRQVRQNKKDIEELYELSDNTNQKVNTIASVQQVHGERLGRIEGQLGSVEGRLGNVEGQLGNVEGQLSGVDGRLGTIEATQSAHGTKLDEILVILKAP